MNNDINDTLDKIIDNLGLDIDTDIETITHIYLKGLRCADRNILKGIINEDDKVSNVLHFIKKE